MIDLLFLFRCDESHVLRIILSVFFEYVSTGTREACGKWSGTTILCVGGLSCACDLILILNDLMEGVPKVCDGFVFGGHGENLFDLAI